MDVVFHCLIGDIEGFGNLMVVVRFCQQCENLPLPLSKGFEKILYFRRNLRRIGRELGVAYLLEGSVRRAGDTLRINAQLIDVENDQHLWAETFDREMTVENIFDIQSEITRLCSR